MGHVVCELEQSALFNRREVRDVAEAMQKPPLRAEFPEPIDPNLSSRLIVTLRKDK